MNIVYTFDDSYTAITAVSMLSLLENNKHINELNLYVVDCGIKSENIDNFKNIAKKYNRTIKFIVARNMEERIPIKLDFSCWSFVCYIRLFFSELLPDVDRVIHIDSDTIIRGCLDDVYNLELNGKLCAACYDCIPSPKFVAGFKNTTGYFSNGLLLFDLKSMREKKIQQMFINYIIEKEGKLPHLDQDVINAVLADRIYVLPPNYNLMTHTIIFGSKMCKTFNVDEPYYSPQEIEDAIKEPIMVHIVGYRFINRPWSKPSYHPYNKEWNSYYKKLELKNEISLSPLQKKRKYNFIRNIACIIWSIGYKIPFIKNIEFLMEKKRLDKMRLKYEK